MKRRKFTEASIPSHLKALIRYQRGNRVVTYCKLVRRGLARDHESIVATAHAICGAKEQFNKKIGRAIAIGRALSLYYNGDRRISNDDR